MLGLIILAAERGTGLAPEAMLEPLLGVPLLARGIAAGLPSDESVTAVLVVPAALVEQVQRDIVQRFGLDEVDQVVAGGADRLAALQAGLAHLPADVEWVVVQEAARVLVPSGLVDRVVAAAKAGDCAVPALAPRASVAVDADGRLVRVDPSQRLVELQGPQAFRVPALRQWAETSSSATSERALEVELCSEAGLVASVVPGDVDNQLIVDAADVSRAVEVFARRALDYAFLVPAELLADDPMATRVDSERVQIEPVDGPPSAPPPSTEGAVATVSSVAAEHHQNGSSLG